MRPTPRKLALLMAVAGLGLSLGQAAHANRDPQAPTGDLGWVGLTEGSSDSPGATELEGWASLPDGPLDATLTTADVAPAPSAEDRAAVALAMVLMADPPSAWPTTLPIAGFATTARWQPSADFRRDFEPGERMAEAASAHAKAVSGAAEDRGDAAPIAVAAAATPASAPLDLDLTAPPGVDVDLDLTAPTTVNVNLDLAASAGVDVNLELPPVLDLDLSLNAGLDLNLDLSPGLDLLLDRPPVFATTRLRPAGTANQAKRSATTSVSERAAAIPVRASASAPLAREQVASHPREKAARVKQARPAEPLPTIIVASHADRVMISLEALLAHDDPMAGGFGARTEDVIVSSHAEKALATLAAICRHDDAELADLHVAQMPDAPAVADVATPISTAAAEPRAGVRGSSGRQDTSQRATRRSALGDDLVAVHEGGLDKVRGGFDAGNGLQISFGIERAVYINGSLVTTTSLNVSELGKMAGGQAAVAAAVAGARNLTLIQNGAGNTFVSGPVSAATAGTVIQNTLNDQKIQSVTSINATVNSLQMMKAQTFEASMRGAITDALRR